MPAVFFLLLSLGGCAMRSGRQLATLYLFDQVRVEAPFDKVDTTRESVITTRVISRFMGKGHISMKIRRWPSVTSPEFKLDELFDSSIECVPDSFVFINDVPDSRN